MIHINFKFTFKRYSMSSNYCFVYDENEVKRFFQKHIKPYEKSQFLSFMIIPTARRKYFKELSCSQTTMRTSIFPCNTKNNEEMLLSALTKLEVKSGCYKDQKTGQGLPSEAFAIYMTVDPLNEVRAYNNLQKQISDRITDMLLKSASIGNDTNENNTNDDNLNHNLNIEKVYKSCLHSCPEKAFKKLDVDSKEENNIDKLKTLFKDNNIVPHLVVETKGGYHVVLNVKNLTKDSQRNLYNFSQENNTWMSIEKPGCLIAIPGTLQAGFKVRMVDWNI